MDNIILRPWKKEDAQALAAIANNKNIWNNVLDNFPSPYTVTDALQWINRESAIIPVSKFAIECNHKIVGGIGLLTYDDIYKCSIELGYFIGEPFWGLGIATKAIEKIVQHIKDDRPGVKRIFARVFENNKASMKALQKAGFYLEGIQKNAAVKNSELVNIYVLVKLV
ncbi:MAG TPA: GNAT family N-acetyltransferase [Chitinophagaceae bacterium]|nr:GNAT family N-acetyltransferase [Chitinophagaceae bacterium]MCC6635203.1 GNAT family N-acetyltransferase [Chitinophagaceae bacterium]HMZ46292.1 GNAT family N-acetyltransferase [Chitinophagaceae bacterium]HNE92994.1 GNAT family N-acetyltransferase [Chitinophagaceae bacterium]HNF29645.1 GNAT family N-acetyltransferase [Chitinophagaceae bacterium]